MRMFNRIFNFGFSAVMALSMVSCTETEFDSTDVPFGQPGDRAETIEVPLRLHTDKPSVIGKPLVNDVYSRAEGDEDPADPEKAAEEAIKNIWVFQYDNKGNQLIAPRYYEVNTTIIKELNIRLAEGEESRVYVLANTSDPEWAKDKDLTTIEKFVAYEYPFTEDNVEMGKDEYLLMEGNVKETIKKETDLLPVDIHLTRMMAKISFKYITTEASKNLKVTRVIINNMPEKMRMEETPVEENYPGPNGEDFATRSVTIDKRLASGEVYTFYMPANRRGETDNTDPSLKNNGAPDKALYVQLFVTSRTNGSNFLYTIYLGANDKNDYNVRRNHNYNITLNLKSENRDDRVLAAPANCFVLNTTNQIMFDPYTRTETGGGFKYSDYVNKNVPEKKIASARIIWQETNVIGNNSDGKRVYLDDYNRIHVKAGTAVGNALIGGYNEAGKLLWSWHIWVNNDKPANLDEAVPYYTFEWDNNGIKAGDDKRTVKGRSLMKCNLGAKSAQKDAYGLNTYGTVYQWGRKDPFPLGWKVDHYPSGYYAYSSGNVGTLYDNEYNPISMTTDGSVSTTELFSTEKVSATTGTIAYVTEHPTHFISPVIAGESYNVTPANHANDADWYWEHNDSLWGGTSYELATKKFVVSANIELTDNGAKEKSIFDPCPAGWMVPPGDMWLGFTQNGLNASSYATINSRHKSDNTGYRGFQMYVQEWNNGEWVYFPSQGLRTMGGKPWRNGMCGNYHTSTASKGGRVNILHLHTPGALSPFETDYGYTGRAVGGPVRCVRDVDE